MGTTTDWQCGDCGTLIDGLETRKCPNCGGINFYPLAAEVPGDEHDRRSVESGINIDDALDYLSRDES